ncbi:major facilitator superfamily domain-containing protein [Radiomyces spectabilis]|uniref:major facilitator superfamily domain-containing protein n=1 Tax=Radiomyces spectabilis TaxID=64574 RepID=UPI00221F33E2|nr:major facilitator superfamily domain-containing protein [Radiomyces spectabilis]KAI8364746.1 major facilitator superfamily domain-containing protein [Radiomyces spectabilis]
MASSFVLPKLLYICLYALLGSAIPYLSLFYDEALHLPSKQIGMVLAIAPFVQSVACPIWTVVADRRPQWHGPLMAILAAIGGVSVMSLMFLPGWLVKNDSTSSFLESPDTESLTLMVTAALALVFAFFGQPVTALVDSAVLKMLGDQKILYGNQRLWGSISNGVNILIVGLLISKVGINVAFYVFAAGVTSFVVLALFTKVTDSKEETAFFVPPQDDMVQDQRQPLLKSPNHPIRSNYVNPHEPELPLSTSVRSTSFFSALTNVLSGHSVDQRPPRVSNYAYEPEEAMARRNSCASHANTVFLEDDNNHLHLLRTTTTSIAARDLQNEANELMSNMDQFPPLGLALSHIPSIDVSLAGFAAVGDPDTQPIEKSQLRSPKVWTFLVTTLLFGISYSMIAQFLFLFLRNDLGMESALIGWTGPIGGVAEVSTFYVSKQLADNYSITALITFAHVILVARNMVYTLLQPSQLVSTAVALGMQLVNGMSYALMWALSVNQVDSFFAEDQRSMAQGILAALFSGLGFGLGCIFGGFVYGQYGANMLFEVSAAIALLSLGVFLLGRWSRS